VIRAVLRLEDGRALLLLGLDRENITRLTGGQPILVEGLKHGLNLPVDFAIFSGETLKDVGREIAEALAVQGDGRRAAAKAEIVLCVDRENILRLTSGQPIFVDGHALQVDVAIFFGETLKDVELELAKAGFPMPRARS